MWENTLKRKQWSTVDDTKLSELYIQENGTNLAASFFNVDRSSILHRASRIGLKKGRDGQWSDCENQIIKTHYEYKSKTQLMEMLPGRSWESITQHGRLLFGLKRLNQSKYAVDETFFEKWSEHSAYIIGLIMSDGYLFYETQNRNANGLQFELAEYDSDVLYKIKETMNYAGPISVSNRNTVKLQISHKKIIADLIKLGVPATDKTNNACFIKMPDEVKRHFIRGILDGDGCIVDTETTQQITFLGTKQLMDDIKTHLLSIVHFGNNVRKRKCNVFELKINKTAAAKILPYLYDNSTIYLDRKYEKAKKFCNREGISKTP